MYVCRTGLRLTTAEDPTCNVRFKSPILSKALIAQVYNIKLYVLPIYSTTIKAKAKGVPLITYLAIDGQLQN